MKFIKAFFLALLFGCAFLPAAHATERLFTYTYEPETMPQGAWEVENWVTARVGRNETVGQKNYDKWEFRQELEYGVTDNYLLSVYLNEENENFRDPATGEGVHDSKFDGVSIENKLLVLDPSTSPVGLALYLEPSFGPDETELEEKIILGQRFGADKEWKWAFNAVHATEWKDGEDGEGDETEGELEFDLGVTREMGKNWNLGVEFRNHNELPEYDEWENSVFFVGPVLNFRRESWWVSVTALFQVYGYNGQNPDPDGRSGFELEGHEYVNVRCIVGLSF